MLHHDDFIVRLTTHSPLAPPACGGGCGEGASGLSEVSRDDTSRRPARYRSGFVCSPSDSSPTVRPASIRCVRRTKGVAMKSQDSSRRPHARADERRRTHAVRMHCAECPDGHAGPAPSVAQLVEPGRIPLSERPHSAPAENQIPELRVPLRVGLAFLPTQNGAGPTAAQRDELLERIRQRFADRKIRHRDRHDSRLLPAQQPRLRGTAGRAAPVHDRRHGAGFEYDQVEHMDENEWSLGYLTIVGAYVLKGSHHDVATLVDLAVVDPVTQSLILRAGGTDSRNRNTTLIDQEREARESSAAKLCDCHDADGRQLRRRVDEVRSRRARGQSQHPRREARRRRTCRRWRELRAVSARRTADPAGRAPVAP